MTTSSTYRHVLKANNDDVIDIQARSMREKLLFFGFAEPQTPDERRSENWIHPQLNYCEKELTILNASANIKIEHAHRIGRFEHAEMRPIVVKFNHYHDKLSVKQKCLDSQKATGENERSQIGVSEQFPKAIQDKRKQISPFLVKAKRDSISQTCHMINCISTTECILFSQLLSQGIL